MAELRTIQTENSTYEVDDARKRIRRVRGVNPPTERFVADGVWHEFESISVLPGGVSVVYWPDGAATITTPEV